MQTSETTLTSSAALTQSWFEHKVKKKREWDNATATSFFPLSIQSSVLCSEPRCVSGGCWHDSTVSMEGFCSSFWSKNTKCKVNFSTSALAKDIQQTWRVYEGEPHAPVRRGREGRGRAGPLANASTGLVWNICGVEEAAERTSRESAPKKTTPLVPKPTTRIWEEGSDLAAPADGKLNQSSYQTSQWSASVRSPRT